MPLWLLTPIMNCVPIASPCPLEPTSFHQTNSDYWVWFRWQHWVLIVPWCEDLPQLPIVMHVVTRVISRQGSSPFLWPCQGGYIVPWCLCGLNLQAMGRLAHPGARSSPWLYFYPMPNCLLRRSPSQHILGYWFLGAETLRGPSKLLPMFSCIFFQTIAALLLQCPWLYHKSLQDCFLWAPCDQPVFSKLYPFSVIHLTDPVHSFSKWRECASLPRLHHLVL